MKSEMKWVIGIIVSLISILIPFLFYVGVFNSPNIVLVRHPYSGYTCPTVLYSEFKILFLNSGSEDTSLCVNLSSTNENVSFVKRDDCLVIFPDKNNAVPFILRVDEHSVSRLDNVTIEYTFSYLKYLSLQNHTISCLYNRKNKWDSNLFLDQQKYLN